MQIRIESHTLKRALERGANEQEITEVLTTGTSVTAKEGRLAKTKVFGFNAIRNGKHYHQKRIEVYFILEDSTIVTVTVYVYYGKWEE